MAQVALRLTVSVSTCYFYARASFIALLPRFMFLDRSFVKNGLHCLEGRGVSRVTVAPRRRDSQARRPSALKGLEASLLDHMGFP
jgi:hypothetical protein